MYCTPVLLLQIGAKIRHSVTSSAAIPTTVRPTVGVTVRMPVGVSAGVPVATTVSSESQSTVTYKRVY